MQNLYFDILFKHVSLLLPDDIPYLKSLLNDFEDVKQISNWSIKGQILKDFIELNEKVSTIQK